MPAQTITVTTGTTYQTMTGWEGAAPWGCIDDTPVDMRTLHTLWRDQVVEKLIDMGINRTRVEMYSGTENPTDYFGQYIAGQISRQTWRNNWHNIINDNADPKSINASGFQWSHLDYQINGIVIPLRAALAKRGETLHLNLCYVDFGSSAFEHKATPAEYGEFVLATYQHMDTTYGFLPDTWEVILEPDTGSASWSAQQTADCLVAARSRLIAAGYTPNFIAPSCTNATNVSTIGSSYFDGLNSTTNALTSISEISYHVYGGNSTAVRNAIRTDAQAAGKKTSMLEFIGATKDTLYDDLTEADISASLSGLAYAYPGSDAGGKYIEIDTTNYPVSATTALSTRSNYLRQWFKYVRAGAIRVAASSSNGNLKPVSFKNTNDRYVVCINASTSVSNFTVGGIPDGCYGIEYSVGSAPVALADVCITSGNITTSIPAAGTLTIFWKKDNTGCSYTLGSSGATFGLNGGASTVTLTTGAGCKWIAEPQSTWLGVGTRYYTGSQTVGYTVDPGPSRVGTISVGNETFTVTQTPCVFSLTPSGQVFDSVGIKSTLAVTCPAACNWTATPSASWITLTGDNSGVGSGTVSFAVRDNFTGVPRQGTIGVAGQTFLIVQDGGAMADCLNVLNPASQVFNASGGDGSILVQAEKQCAWGATNTNPAWVTFTSDFVGIGTKTVTYHVAPNPNTSGRKTVIKIAGQAFRIKQKGM